jgi:long-chain acyl-CoA synthetase
MIDGESAMKALGYVEAIRRAVAARPETTAVSFAGRQTSWGELLEQAARLAGGLRALGLQSGDRVAVLSANSDLYVLLYLAVPWAGGVLAPLNVRWSAVENDYALDDCTPAFAFVSEVADPDTLALFDQREAEVTLIALDGPVRAGWRAMTDLLAADAVEDAGLAGDDLFGIFYTGGTTGRSKGVMLSHGGVVGNAMAMRELGLFPDGARALLVTPLFHMAAVAAQTMAMLCGGESVILPGFEPGRALDAIDEHQVTDALFVPTMIQMMLDAPGFEPSKLRSLVRIMYGASPMTEATLDRAMAAAPHADFFQCYGMTELSPTAVMLTPELHRGEHRAAGRHRGAGRPIRDVEIRIADEAGNPVPQGEVGQVLVRSPGVMLGYWNQPDQTQKALVDGWMHTGDGGRIDDHGVLYVVDRIKDMIVSGAENVYSAEVESALSRHPDIAQCAVIGVPDPRWGERVHAVIVGRPGAELSSEGVIDHCRRLIAGYKCPRSIELRSALPMSAAGKILKADLRAPYWEGQGRNVA